MRASEVALEFALFLKQWLSSYFKTSKKKSHALPWDKLSHRNQSACSLPRSTARTGQLHLERQTTTTHKNKSQGTVQAGLQLTILLPLPSTYQDFRHASPSFHLAICPLVCLTHSILLQWSWKHPYYFLHLSYIAFLLIERNPSVLFTFEV